MKCLLNNEGQKGKIGHVRGSVLMGDRGQTKVNIVDVFYPYINHEYSS
jgi:hypothetical protein